MLLPHRALAGLCPVLVTLLIVGWLQSSPSKAPAASAPMVGLVEPSSDGSADRIGWKASADGMIDFDSLVVERHANGARSVDLNGYTSMIVVTVDEDGTIHEACVSSAGPSAGHDHAPGKACP